jgi:hypothetical protein
MAVYVSNEPSSVPAPHHMADVAVYEIAVEFNECDLPYVLCQGDRIIRQATGLAYEVLTPRLDGNGHVRVTLCEIDTAN